MGGEADEVETEKESRRSKGVGEEWDKQASRKRSGNGSL